MLTYHITLQNQIHLHYSVLLKLYFKILEAIFFKDEAVFFATCKCYKESAKKGDNVRH